MAVTRHALVVAGRARIHYSISGFGPGLMLVHGTGADGETTWGEMVDRFTDRNTVILPDLSGCGTVRDSGAALTVSELADQVTAVIVASGRAPVDLVGFSLGASVAAAAAAMSPELVRRLVLVAGWVRTDAYIRNLMSAWSRIAGDEEAFGRFAVLTAYSPAFVNGLTEAQLTDMVAVVRPTEGTMRQIDLDLRLDIRALLSAIQAPTLVIGCGQDRTIPVTNTRQLHAGIRSSRYVEIDCGHVAHVERPDEFLKEVKEFLHGPDVKPSAG